MKNPTMILPAKTLQPPTDAHIPAHCDLMVAMFDGLLRCCTSPEYAAMTILFPVAFVFLTRFGKKEGRDMLIKALNEAINAHNEG